MKLRAIVLGGMGLALASCNNTAPDHQVNGWAPLALGMSYDEALVALPQASWNPVALEKCQEELAIKGCFLSQFGNEWHQTVDGIAFAPQLTFDKHGKLSKINLMYSHEGGISRDECLDVLSRTVDILHSNFGPVAFPLSGEKEDWPREIKKSATGVEYAITSKDGQFFGVPIRAQIENVQLPTKRPISDWNDKRYANVMGFFVIAQNTALCHVDLMIEEPNLASSS